MPATLHIYVPPCCYYSLHMDPTLLHTSVKKQQNHNFYLCVTARNMPMKYHIYAKGANYLTGINGGSMPIYMPHIDSLVSIR